MDRFLALTVFTKVVEHGSFAGAAEELELSRAAVTQHVQSLEQHLKTRLLHRTTRRVSPTDEGLAYYEHCRQILERMEEADAMLASHRASPKGTLRVMVPQLLGTLILIPAMPGFLDRYPDLRIEYTLSSQTPDLVAQGLDLALSVTAQPSQGVVFRPLGLCPIRTVASPGYLARYGVPQTPDELEHHKLIGVRAVPGVYLATWRFQRDGRMFSRDFDCRLLADIGEAQRAAALADGGIFQALSYAVKDLIDAGRLVPILEDWQWSGLPMGAVHLPNRFLAPKVQVFLEFARQLLAPSLDPYRVDWDNR